MVPARTGRFMGQPMGQNGLPRRIRPSGACAASGPHASKGIALAGWVRLVAVAPTRWTNQDQVDPSGQASPETSGTSQLVDAPLGRQPPLGGIWVSRKLAPSRSRALLLVGTWSSAEPIRWARIPKFCCAGHGQPPRASLSTRSWVRPSIALSRPGSAANAGAEPLAATKRP